MADMDIILSAICLNAVCNNSNAPSLVPFEFNNFLDTNLQLHSESTSVKEFGLTKLREELSGQVLRIGTLEDFPLSYTETVNGTAIGSGVAFRLLEFLMVKFNFTYTIVKPQKNIVGSTDDMAGSLLELLKNDKVDLIATFLPILADARNFTIYSTTSLEEGEWIMIMVRPLDSAGGSGLLAPFDQDVWILILISLIIVGPIIYVLIIIRNKLTGDQEQKIYRLPHCVWFVYGGLMKQGSTLSPIGDSTRMVFATWWIFITILTSFYTANLTAFLTLSKFTLPINTVEDILKKEKPFVAHRGGAVEYVIRNNNEQLTQLSRMVEKNLVQFTESLNDTDILATYVQKKDFVFVRDRPAIDHMIYADYKYRTTQNNYDEKVQCPFAVSKTPFMKRRRTFAYPKNTKWNLLFDTELLHLVESGIVKFMLLDGLPNAEICPQNLAGSERQLRNGDLLTTYYVMIAGFVISAVVFITEMFFKCVNILMNRNATEKGPYKKAETPSSMIPTITPPPPYATLFNRRKNSLKNDSDTYVEPSFDYKDGKRQRINGREYLVVRDVDGASRLIPLRAPSAALFQYAYTK